MDMSERESLAYQLVDGLRLGVAVDDMDPATEPGQEPPTKWYEQPVDWLLDLVGNVNYIDKNVRVSTNEGVLTIDRSGGTPISPPPSTVPVVNVASPFASVPPVVWWGGAAVLALLLLKK